jgi:demethylmenaquinone methyltransferase/2-methoxy-6-polyprenyl-1,4-benzoquinol methylase
MNKFEHDKIVPYKSSSLSKKEQIADMFNSISKKYDFLNRFLSVGVDNYWRKKALNELRELQPKTILDVATGTADVAIMAEKKLNPDKITGIDISEGMLDVGRKKISELHLNDKIELLLGDSEAIKYPDNTFDAVTVAFGVRNFQNLEKGLSEIKRVLKPNGKLVVLEFSKPKSRFIRLFYNLYMKVITPNIGKLFSKNKSAYSYLDASIKKFPEGNEFKSILDSIGYFQSSYKPLSFGICSIYCAIK